MGIKFNLVSLGDQENLTAFINGEMYVASQDHPRWDQLVAGIRAGDESVANLFDPQKDLNEKFHRLTERVSIRGGKVYFDNEFTDDLLAKEIVRVYEEDGDFEPLVNFMEKVATNPEDDSRAHLYTFLNSKGEFTITHEGDFLAYKGVHGSDKEEYSYRSGNQGHAIVDGEEQNGYIYQNVGSVVEMPRGEVTHDPYKSCSAGLHVGTHSYASGYGTVLVRVVINPRDVVSVPRGEGEKMRVCRYVVVEENSAPVETSVYAAPMTVAADSWDDDDEEVECYCGYSDCSGDSDCDNF